MTAPKVAGKARFRFAEETAAIPKGAILPKTKVFDAAKQSTAQTAMLKRSGAAVLSILGIFSEKDFVLTAKWGSVNTITLNPNEGYLSDEWYYVVINGDSKKVRHVMPDTAQKDTVSHSKDIEKVICFTLALPSAKPLS